MDLYSAYRTITIKRCSSQHGNSGGKTPSKSERPMEATGEKPVISFALSEGGRSFQVEGSIMATDARCWAKTAPSPGSKKIKMISRAQGSR